jgi:hypothetical protein
MSEKDVSVFVADARDPPHDEDVVDTWFAPGRVVFMDRLIDRGFTIDRLFALPFHYALMCIRDEKLRTFHVDFLRRFDDRFHSVDILFSPWMEELEGAWCRRIGLTIERLIQDGLTRRHVRQLNMRLSRWNDLFGMTDQHIKELGIVHYGEYFADLAEDMVSPVAARIATIVI